LTAIRSASQALRGLQRLTFDEFSANILYTSTAERLFQVAIQAAIDVGEHVLSELNAEPPSDYADVFVKLAEVGVIPARFAHKLAAMARFRNILVHLYLEVDVARVYDYLQHNLGDFERYARYVTTFLDRHEQAGTT